MAGIFTHLAAVCSIYASLRARTAAIGDKSLRYAIAKYPEYVDLGSISPDSPYLHWLNMSSNSKNWGNLMHYCCPGDFIREGIRFLSENESFSKEDRQKATAWLFGYASHVVMDLTIHPVVELKVGCYDGHEREHKYCETQQDAYIFPKVMGVSVIDAEYLKDAGLRSCVDEHTGNLHGLTTAMWTYCAQAIKRKAKEIGYRPVPRNKPEPQAWFVWFTKLLDYGAEEGHRILFVSRKIKESGLACPKIEDIDMEHIERLQLPDGTKTHFDSVFEQGRKNVMRYWSELSNALVSKDIGKFKLPNGNLDTGRVDDTEKYMFW